MDKPDELRLQQTEWIARNHGIGS